MKSRDERLAEYVSVSALLSQAKAELMRYPGVRDVAVGSKEEGDAATETTAFRVYVTEKKAPSELSPAEMIPKSIFGIPTDVVREPIVENHVDDDKYRPLMGGIQIGNDPLTTYGTLGCVARRNGDHSVVILSNRHVMLAGHPAADAGLGSKIGQPEPACCCCCKTGIVGEVVNALSNGLVDCAIARITGETPFTNEVHEIGPILGSAPLNAGLSTVVQFDRVMKRGRTTGLTTGTVVTPRKSTGASSTAPARTDQIEIKPDAGFTRFSDHGDSGSVVLDENNVVVGLLWGGDHTIPNGNSFASLITNVVSAMDITIMTSGTAGTVELSGTSSADAIAADAEIGPLDPVVRVLEQSAAGRDALAFFRRYGNEINDLINANRQVKVAWHRYQGPAFTAHLLRSAREPSHRLPSQLEGISPENLLIRMSVVLQEHGSPELAAAVDEHTLPLLNMIHGATSVHELLERIEAVDAVGALVS